MSCPFTIQIWKGIFVLEECGVVFLLMKDYTWCNPVVKKPKSFPLLVALNAQIFEGRYMYMAGPYVFFRVFLF